MKSSTVAVQSPGKIDNKILLNSTKHLKTNLSEEIDYNTIPEELWTYLTKIYGIAQEEDTIERLVIDDGDNSLLIEIRPLNVSVSCSEYIVKDAIQPIVMSRQSTMEEVVEKIKNSLKAPVTGQRPMRLFFKSKDNKSMHPVEIDKTTINNAGYGIQDVCLL